MQTPTITELTRLTCHQRQVAYVRPSLPRGIEHEHEGKPAAAKRR